MENKMDPTTIEGLKERNAWLTDEILRFQHANETQAKVITELRREKQEFESKLYDCADKYTDASFKYNGAADKVMQLTIRCRQLAQMLEDSAKDNIGLQEMSRIMRDALKTIKHTDCDAYKIAGKALLDTKAQ